MGWHNEPTLKAFHLTANIWTDLESVCTLTKNKFEIPRCFAISFWLRPKWRFLQQRLNTKKARGEINPVVAWCLWKKEYSQRTEPKSKRQKYTIVGSSYFASLRKKYHRFCYERNFIVAMVTKISWESNSCSPKIALCFELGEKGWWEKEAEVVRSCLELKKASPRGKGKLSARKPIRENMVNNIAQLQCNVTNEFPIPTFSLPQGRGSTDC